MSSAWYCGCMSQCLAPGIHRIHNGDILICVICPVDQRRLKKPVLARLSLKMLHIASLSDYWHIQSLGVIIVNVLSNGFWASFFKITTTLSRDPGFFPQNLVCVWLPLTLPKGISLFSRSTSARKSQIYSSSPTERKASFFLFHALKQSFSQAVPPLPVATNKTCGGCRTSVKIFFVYSKYTNVLKFK